MSVNTTKKQPAWLLPSSEKKDHAPAGLYLVSTPIGNMRDMTVRGLDMLAAADLILCEDTRVTGKLLSHYDISGAPLWAYTDHNADKQRPNVLEKIRDGARVVLVSDAGTPLVSDPGYKLVRECAQHDLYVTSLPGANAPLTALQLSAMPSDAFTFIGFLPPKQEAQKQALKRWTHVQGSMVIFESARRTVKTLETILSIWGDRPAAVVREMTKLFEEARRGRISELLAHYAENDPPKGEVVLVIGAGEQKEYSEDELEALLREALASMSTKDAAAFVAEETGLPKKQLYNMAVKLT